MSVVTGDIPAKISIDDVSVAHRSFKEKKSQQFSRLKSVSFS